MQELLKDTTKMEPYKYNMAECTHSAEWQENMLGKKCMDCGFDTFSNDHGMYDNYRPKGLSNLIKDEVGNNIILDDVIIICGNSKMDAINIMKSMSARMAKGVIASDFDGLAHAQQLTYPRGLKITNSGLVTERPFEIKMVEAPSITPEPKLANWQKPHHFPTQKKERKNQPDKRKINRERRKKK